MRLPASSLLISFLLISFISTADAHCGKDVTVLLKYAVDNAPSNFKLLAGESVGGGSKQVNMSKAAEDFCPNKFILSAYPATDKSSEEWVLKFVARHHGTDGETVLWLIKEFTPILKTKNYQDRPYYKDVDGGSWLKWESPSHTYVIVKTFEEEDRPGEVLFEIKVGHQVM